MRRRTTTRSCRRLRMRRRRRTTRSCRRSRTRRRRATTTRTTRTMMTKTNIHFLHRFWPE